jgi:hypothetical protein
VNGTEKSEIGFWEAIQGAVEEAGSQGCAQSECGSSVHRPQEVRLETHGENERRWKATQGEG